jgi:hypothetical protein
MLASGPYRRSLPLAVQLQPAAATALEEKLIKHSEGSLGMIMWPLMWLLHVVGTEK